jgi:hypothetical protein
MTLIYAALFFACLVGVCVLVLIGDLLRRAYIQWLGCADICIRDEAERHVYIESLLMH